MKILFRSRDISYKVLRPFKKITYFRVSRLCILEVRVTGIIDHKPTTRESMTNYCLALQERNIRKLVEGKEVFNILETEKEGILGATKLYPGVLLQSCCFYI